MYAFCIRIERRIDVGKDRTRVTRDNREQRRAIRCTSHWMGKWYRNNVHVSSRQIVDNNCVRPRSVSSLRSFFCKSRLVVDTRARNTIYRRNIARQPSYSRLVTRYDKYYAKWPLPSLPCPLLSSPAPFRSVDRPTNSHSSFDVISPWFTSRLKNITPIRAYFRYLASIRVNERGEGAAIPFSFSPFPPFESFNLLGNGSWLTRNCSIIFIGNGCTRCSNEIYLPRKWNI